MTIESTDKVSSAPGTEEVSKGNIPATLANLAERCERENEPDRALDIEIAVAIDWRYADWEKGEHTAREMAEKHGLAWLISRSVEGYNSTWRHLPRFTASLDAAVTLIPSGYDIAELKSSPSGCAVRLWIPSNAACGYGRRSSGTTKALAICAAALRAIEQ